jgi:hypothetical protein
VPKRIRSIDVYLPLDYNDGTPIGKIKFLSLQQELLDRFGGITMTQRRFPLQGIWKSETSVFQDRVVVHTVLDFDSKEFELFRYLQSLKKRLKRVFEQLEILITVQELTAI